MLFDVFFFGLPLTLGGCLAAHAVRDQNTSFWRPAFSFLAYCAFYLAGGREVVLYLLALVIMGGGWTSCEWAML